MTTVIFPFHNVNRNVLEFAVPKTWWKLEGEDHVNDAWQTVKMKLKIIFFTILTFMREESVNDAWQRVKI